MQLLEDFFTEIDRSWRRPPAQLEKLQLSLIGSGALMLQASYERGTKDSDVFETHGLPADIQPQLKALVY